MKRILALLLFLLGACAGEAPPPVAPTSSAPSSLPAPSAPPLDSAPPPAFATPPGEAATSGTRGVTLAPSSGAAALPGVAPSFSTYCAARDASGAVRPVVSGDTLRSGDHFWLELTAHEPLYVYAVYVAADGSASVLYPSSGDLLLAPGRVQRLPETQDFELDRHTGLERLIVVAARDVLGRSASSLAELVNRVRTTHRWSGRPQSAPAKTAAPVAARATLPRPAPAPRAVPATQVYNGPTTPLESGYAGVDTRGIVLSGSPRGHVDVVPDADGVIAIPLLIEHVP